MPGDLVSVRAGRRKRKGRFYGTVVEVIEAPAARAQPLCPHFGTCGGCTWQQVPYSTQLAWKDEILQRQLRSALASESLDTTTFLPPLESPRAVEYRNKMEYSFSSRRWFSEPAPGRPEAGPAEGPAEAPADGPAGEPKDRPDDASMAEENYPADYRRALGQADDRAARHDDPFLSDRRALGLFVPGNPNRVVDIEECVLQDHIGNRIRNHIRQVGKGRGDEFYDHRDRKGYLRTLVIRTNAAGQVLVLLIFGDDNPAAEEAYRVELRDRFPEIVSCYFMTNEKLNDSYGDLEARHQFGEAWLTEELDGLVFHIGPLSFFQTNIAQTPRLYARVVELAELTGEETVFDLYCGTGTISAYLARKARKVVGLEYVPEAVEAARRACAENGLTNAVFYAGDMKSELTEELFAREGRPRVLVADPPRAGMHEAVLRRILEAAPQRVVYVSCNPSSLARDLSILVEAYRIESVQAIDMAPHTPHIEALVSMRLKS